MKTIKVLGTGCPTCHKFEMLVRKTVEDLKIDAQVVKEDDIMKIISYGVRRTPSLVIDEKVVLHGHVPNEKELVELLIKE